MTNTPLVSVIVPCYNQGQYLAEALDSVLAQTYTNWECIIVNDGSTDSETEPVAQSYVAKDKRFKYLKQENGGVSAARNAGLDICQGEYIRFLDADDWIGIELLRLSISHCGKQTLVLSQIQSFHQLTKNITPHYYKLILSDLTFENVLMNFGETFDIPIHCASISADLLNGFKFNTTLHAGEDWVMWLHIFKQDPKITIIDQPLVWYRKWADSATMQLNQGLKHRFLAIQYVKRHFDVPEGLSVKMDYRVISSLMNKIEKLENDLNFIKRSTSFKIGYFIASKLSFFKSS
jgi:glycosyltransferase involved in cell wall biosynthesis